MGTYEAVRLRIFQLCEEKHVAIYKLSVKSSVPPSTIKNVLYGKSRNPGIVTLKMICDGFGITLEEFFNEKYFGETARLNKTATPQIENFHAAAQEEVAAANAAVLNEG